MLKKFFYIYIFFIGLLATNTSLKAQTETRADTTTSQPRHDTVKPENNLWNNNLNPRYPSQINENAYYNFLQKQPFEHTNFPTDFSKINFNLERYLKEKNPNPFAVKTPYYADFSYSGIKRISGKATLTAFQKRETFLLIGTKENIGADILYRVNDKVSLLGGASVDKYRDGQMLNKYDLNLNAEINYRISDNVLLTFFGMHSFSKTKNEFSKGMFGGRPQTYFGSNILFPLGEKTDMGLGAYGASYSIDGAKNHNFGFKGEIGYWISDRLKIGAIGQYSLQNNKDYMSQRMGAYPQSYYGGFLEFKVTDDWGIRGGTKREFDHNKRKWVTTPYFEVVSYKK